jgi:hypothetical protein
LFFVVYLAAKQIPEAWRSAGSHLSQIIPYLLQGFGLANCSDIQEGYPCGWRVVFVFTENGSV